MITNLMVRMITLTLKSQSFLISINKLGYQKMPIFIVLLLYY